MDWEKLILQQLSRKLVDQVIEDIVANPLLFDELFPYIYSENQRLAWRTAWIFTHLHKRMPSFFDDKLKELMVFLPKTPYNGVRRSLLNLIFNSSCVDFSVDFINHCFEWMVSPKQDPAIQVYSMYCLCKVCKIYLEFIPELQACLETIDFVEYSKGFNSARKKTLKTLQKLS